MMVSGSTTKLLIKLASRKVQKSPKVSQIQFLLVRLQMSCISSPEAAPMLEPAIKEWPTLRRMGAEEETTIPPVRVPSKAYLNPTLPLPPRADPAYVPIILAANAKNTLSLALALQAEPQSIKLLLKNINNMKMKALPSAARDIVTRLDVISDGISFIFLKQIRLSTTAKTEPNKYTQEPPQASKQIGLKSGLLIECLMTRLKARFQKKSYNTVIKTTCTKVILPISAVITVSSEIVPSIVFYMITQLASIRKFWACIQQDLTLSATPPESGSSPNPSTTDANKNFCISGPNWILIAVIIIVLPMPSHEPNLNEESSKPKPTRAHSETNILGSIYLQATAVALFSGQQQPRRP